VRVRGEVRQVYEPYDGLTLITVRDETGSIPVAVSDDLVTLSGITPALSAGQVVEVVAAVSLYGNTPQLAPASATDIVLLDQGVRVAVEKPIGELTTMDVGQLVVVRGIVASVDAFSSGVKYTVDDGSSTIVVLLWQDVYMRASCKFSRLSVGTSGLSRGRLPGPLSARSVPSPVMTTASG
jgi:RecJ-like exonuclease